MKNNQSSLQSSKKSELSFFLINNKNLLKTVEKLRIQENLSWELEYQIRNIKLLNMLEDFINEHGVKQVDVLSKNRKINKVDNSYFNNSFRNSFKKMDDKNGYVEGYMIHKENPNYKIYHSWNITQDGEFIDFTSRVSSEFDYIGVVIPNDIVSMVVHSIDENENRKGFIHLPILPFLKYYVEGVRTIKQNKKRDR
jgi:hypothetical protein